MGDIESSHLEVLPDLAGGKVVLAIEYEEADTVEINGLEFKKRVIYPRFLGKTE